MEPPMFESEGLHAKRELEGEEEEEEEPLEEDELPDAVKQSSLTDFLGKENDDAVFTAEDVFYDQELISGVMKSLAAEITGSSPVTIPTSELSSPSIDNPTFAENDFNAAAIVDLEYLLGATDDELGIPPSPNYVAENEYINVIDAQNPSEDLFENPQAESQAEWLMQLYGSDIWNLPYEYDFAMLNDSLCLDNQTRSLQGEEMYDWYECLPMDKAQTHLLESGVGM